MAFDLNALAGTEILFLQALLVPLDPSLSSVFLPGSRLTLTPLVLAASIDHTGGSWLALLDDEPGQRERWGDLAIARAA